MTKKEKKERKMKTQSERDIGEKESDKRQREGWRKIEEI